MMAVLLAEAVARLVAWLRAWPAEAVALAGDCVVIAVNLGLVALVAALML